MKVLLVEDEELAAERLAIMLKKYDSNIEITATLDSVKTVVNYFNTNPMPDLCFLDIQLADGLSFEIFEQVKITCPVIFTTAYDEYALRAFKVNSIDYLLKPIDLEEITRAFTKLNTLKSNTTPTPSIDLGMLQQTMKLLTKQYKSRFMVKIGEHLTSVPIEEIAYFYSESKATWFKHITTGKRYMLDYTLDQIEDLVDPKRYFRLNRKYHSSIEAVKDIISYSNSRLKVVLKDPPDKEDILVSREKVQEFKEWMDS
jgi:two-component system, LytTR family, response regulator